MRLNRFGKSSSLGVVSWPLVVGALVLAGCGTGTATGSSVSTISLDATIVRSLSSIDFVYRYAESMISSIWKPCSIAATAPPFSSIAAMYSQANFSTSSVNDSTRYDPAIGSGVSTTPDS